MRRIMAGFFCALTLCLLAWHFSLAEIPDLRLSLTTLADLNRLKEDIAGERKLHYTLDDAKKEEVKRAAEEIIEREFMSMYQSKVEWAWYGWEYKYTRDKDFYTFETHLHYMRYRKKIRTDVKAEIIWDGTGYELERLYLGGRSVVARYNEIPENHLIDQSNSVINQKTGVNISALTQEELKELEEQVNREIDTNHSPRGRSWVQSILRRTVNELYAEKGLTVSWPWPWSGYSVVCDWNCYEVSARITCEGNGEVTKDIPVYAELFPEGDSWRICYLEIGKDVLMDTRDQVQSAEGLLYMNSRRYQKAMLLMKNGSWAEAQDQFAALGDFDNSPEMVTKCRNLMAESEYGRACTLVDSLQYEEALAVFEALGDYSDSQKKAEECRYALSERAYLQAVLDYENKRYDSALKGFMDLSGYKDSNAKAEEVREAVREENYQAALSLEKEKRYNEAVGIYDSLTGYRDSDARRAECLEILNNTAYMEAVALLQAGEYESAAEQFDRLGDYRDSAVQAEKSRGILASINREIFFPESELVLFKGGKTVLSPQVRKLSDSAPETTVLKYTIDSREGGQAVARVDQNGTVTAVDTGESVIHCEAADNALIRADLTVRVVASVTEVELSPARLDLKISLSGQDTRTLQVSFRPLDAYIRTGTWKSSDESVAAVDQEGNVKPLKAGRTVITFTSDDDFRGKKEAKCIITIRQAVTSVELEELSGTLYPGYTIQLKASAMPKDAENRKLTWSSGDESVATVNQKGLVKALQEGETVITVRSPDGPEAQYILTVIPKP